MSTINEQAAIEEMDFQAAEKRLEAMNLPKTHPTLTPYPTTQPAIPTGRKKRSDAGVPKKSSSSADEITLRVTVDVARSMATALAETFPSMSALLQDQIIAQLQKRLDVLQKQK